MSFNPIARKNDSTPSLKAIAPDLMRLGLEGAGGLISDLREAAKLIAPEMAERNSIEIGMSQGAFIRPRESDETAPTPEQFIRARQVFLDGFMKGLELPDTPQSVKAAGEIMLLTTVLNELLDRAKGNTVNFVSLFDPDTCGVEVDGKFIPSSEYKGEAANFTVMGVVDLPDAMRFDLLPEHQAVLQNSAGILSRMKPMLEAAIKRYAGEEPDDLSDDVRTQLEAARRLLLKLDNGLSLPGSTAEPPLLGH